MSVEFEIAGDQIDGARHYQEDAYIFNHLGELDNGKKCALVIMADGMGGHTGGNVASNTVVATFNKSFQTNFLAKEASVALTDSLHRANERIRAAVKETPALRGMGCTMVSVYLEGDNLFWVSVGDSHLYLIRDRKLIKQNADHSYGAYLDMMKDQGVEIGHIGISRNMLMSAMTGEEISSIDVPETPVKMCPGDRVVVASDGLDTLSLDAIIQYSAKSKTAKECVYNLLKAVESEHKINQDNTTLVVVDIKERIKRESPNEQQPESVQPASRAADAKVRDKLKEQWPYKRAVWLIILAIIIAVGYFAWQTG